MFDFEEIRRLVELVQKSGIQEIEVSRFFSRLKIKRNATDGSSVGEGSVARVAAPAPPPVAPPPPEPEAPAAEAADPDAGLTPIRSPMVGTFYKAAAPDAEPYVTVGQSVSSGQVVCIIEAMKLMNEIESDIGGTIVKVLVENAQPVQYDEPLFLVKTG